MFNDSYHELLSNTKDILLPGDVINIGDPMSIEIVRGVVLRNQLMGDINKILFKADESQYNKEYDDLTGQYYCTIVEQELE